MYSSIKGIGGSAIKDIPLLELSSLEDDGGDYEDSMDDPV